MLDIGGLNFHSICANSLAMIAIFCCYYFPIHLHRQLCSGLQHIAQVRLGGERGTHRPVMLFIEVDYSGQKGFEFCSFMFIAEMFYSLYNERSCWVIHGFYRFYDSFMYGDTYLLIFTTKKWAVDFVYVS